MSPAVRVSRRFFSRRSIALALVLGVVSALSVPVVAHADPLTVYDKSGPGYRIVMTQDGYSFSGLEITLTNLGTQTTTYGLAADLETQGVPQNLWDNAVLSDATQTTIDPGDSYTDDLPNWPGTTLQLYSNIDTSPIAIGPSYTTPGVHVRTVISGDSDNPFLEIGPTVTTASSPELPNVPAVPGAGLLVTASYLTPGPVTAFLDASPDLEWSGPNLVQYFGSPVEDIGSGVVAADGTFSLDGVLPTDTPAGQYTVEFSNADGLGVHQSTNYVTVDSDLPQQLNLSGVSVTGTAKVGGTLTADTALSTDPDVHLHYQWLADGEPIAGATASTFVPTDSQIGSTISVQAVAWEAGLMPSDPRVSASTKAVPAAKSFTSTAAPTISGMVAVGQKLTASTPTWAPTTGFSYQWDVDGVPVGTDAKTYTLAPADVSGVVTVTITSTKAGYDPVQAQSDPTAPVAPGQIQPPANANRPSISGQEKVAGTVTLKTGNWTPTPTFGIQWFIAGVAVPGATGTSLTIPATANGVTTVGSLISAQIVASSPGYQDYPVPVSDPTAITKAAKTG